MAKISTNLGSDFLKFTFTDSDGDVFASFRLNPADVKLYERLNGIDSKLQEIEKKFSDQEEDGLTASMFNAAIEELFCYVIGYDVRESLFGTLSALAVMGDGSYFFEKVLDVLQDAVEKEVKKRAAKMQNKTAKYTQKYAK